MAIEGMAMWKRPKTDDDEEELLRQQEEFLKTKQQPSVKVWSKSIRKSDAKQDIVSTLESNGEMINPAVKDKVQETSKEKLEDMVQNVPIASSNIILGNIVEKKFDIRKYKFDNNHVPTTDELGFPQVFVSDVDTAFTEKKTTDKQSLFCQRVLASKPARHNSFEITSEYFCKRDSSHCDYKETSTAIEASEIHKQSLEMLAQMSEAEKLKEKIKLERTLDPKIIQFLKNKRKNNRKSKNISVMHFKPVKRDITQSDLLDINDDNLDIATLDTKVSNDKKMKFLLNNNDDTEIDCVKDTLSVLDIKETTIDMEIPDDKKTKFSSNEMEMDCKNDTLSIPQSSKKLLEESKQKGWLHMDALEPEKLEWMEELLCEKKDGSAPNKEYNARFDFAGCLLPYKDESLTVDKGLHHHGEEPERPGYSLQELLQLSRSSNQQQRCTALTLLANIMDKTHKGWYDKVLHPSPLTALSQKNILLLLRFSLDDSSVAVVTASLQAFKAFLVSEADEICLDRLFGFNGYTEPTLMPHLEDKDTSSLKDHELAQVDAVAALLRSDILLRIRYILHVMRPPPIGVTCALDILIRLARHSHTTALNISFTPYLLDIIIQHFIPLSLEQLGIMIETLESLNLFTAMQQVDDLIMDNHNVYGIPLSKAIKLCRVLVTYGKKPVAQKLDNLKIIQTIITYVNSDIGSSGRPDDVHCSIENLRLWQMLLYYEIGLDSVAGAQLTLVAQLKLWLDYFDIRYSSELDCERAAALIAVAKHEDILYPAIHSLSDKWTRQFLLILKPTWGMMKLRAVVSSEPLTSAGGGISVDVKGASRFWLSEQYIFSTLCSDSNLLSKCNSAIDREPSCLPNLGILMEYGKMQPIVSINSCIPFLVTTLFNISPHVNIRLILESPHILKYLQNLETAEWSLERSWYSRTELYLLTMLVKAAFLARDSIDEQMMQTVWKIAVKLVSALPADDVDCVKKLLEITLYEKMDCMENEISIFKPFKLHLISTSDQSKIPDRDFRSVMTLYEKYVAPNGNWDQAAMPKDWLFLPLVHVYTKCKSNIKLNAEDEYGTFVVLKLALTMSDFMDTLSPTLIFSRLILVYLCDVIYLHKDVSLLLSNVLSNLLKFHYKQLNFQMELPGLTSFTDLFTALCEHFCSNSYGDDNFAIALLVPVAQRHDAHYRKLLWSEHADALRFVRVQPEKLPLPLTEFLYPEEEDTSLIDSYIMALIRGMITEMWCPVPFVIARHHAAMYLRRTNKRALRMRTHVEMLKNNDIINILLSYEPPPSL